MKTFPTLNFFDIPDKEFYLILSALRAHALRAHVFTYVKKRVKSQENVLSDRPTQIETKMKEWSEYFLYTFIGCENDVQMGSATNFQCKVEEDVWNDKDK
jgi:hypothetical protein